MRMRRRRGSRPSGARRTRLPGPRCCGGSGRPTRSRTTRPRSGSRRATRRRCWTGPGARRPRPARRTRPRPYDTLAEVRARSGKLADAVDAARRALELAEGGERRRTLERLIGRLRGSGIDARARAALERALRVLEGPKVAPPARTLSPAEAAGDGGGRRGDGRPAAGRATAAAAAAIPWPDAELGGAVAEVTGRDRRVTRGSRAPSRGRERWARRRERLSRPKRRATAGGWWRRQAKPRSAGCRRSTPRKRIADRRAAGECAEALAEEDGLAEVDPAPRGMLGRAWTRRSPRTQPDLAPLGPSHPGRTGARPAARHRARRPRPARGGGAGRRRHRPRHRPAAGPRRGQPAVRDTGRGGRRVLPGPVARARPRRAAPGARPAVRRARLGRPRDREAGPAGTADGPGRGPRRDRPGGGREGRARLTRAAAPERLRTVPGRSGRGPMVHSAEDAPVRRVPRPADQPDDRARHRDHRDLHLLAVQPDPRDSRRHPRHRGVDPARHLRPGPVPGPPAVHPAAPGGRRRRPVRARRRVPARAPASPRADRPGGRRRADLSRRPRSARSSTSRRRCPRPPGGCRARGTARSSCSSGRRGSRRSPRPASWSTRTSRTSSCARSSCPGRALHDGAVIVRGDQILAAGALLPLTEMTLSERYGTRHGPRSGSPRTPTPWPWWCPRRAAR